MTRLRCAILDDYQNVALQMADWAQLADNVDVTTFNAPFASAAAATEALQDFDIVCAMRERTPFGADVLSALPKLKLLLTSGMRNASFDLDAAKARDIVVCGTGAVGNPTAGLAIGLMLELTRRIGFENARMKAGERWREQGAIVAVGSSRDDVQRNPHAIGHDGAFEPLLATVHG